MGSYNVSVQLLEKEYENNKQKQSFRGNDENDDAADNATENGAKGGNDICDSDNNCKERIVRHLRDPEEQECNNADNGRINYLAYKKAAEGLVCVSEQTDRVKVSTS